MSEPGQLNVRERVLLHLSRLATDVPPSEHSPESSQAGIAQAVGISRTHVPRAVKMLVKEGLAEELRGRVVGHERRMSVYVATSEGVRKATALWGNLAEKTFQVRQGASTERMTGLDLEETYGRKKAIAMVSRMRGGLLEADGRTIDRIRELTEAPAPVEFYGRKGELDSISEFLASDATVMVVLGSKGYGTSALARRCVDGIDTMNVMWISLEGGASRQELEEKLRRFGERIDPETENTEDVLGLSDTLLVFDGFFSVSEEVVEFFTGLVSDQAAAKVLVTGREETPAYNWFYHKRDVDSDTVRVLRVRGLDEDSARELLGRERIEEDAFRRIFAMSRGQPMVLRMLREGDAEGLKKHTLLTAEEVRYLLYLSEKTK